MSEKAKTELRKLVTENFNKYLKLKIQGYCVVYFEIAQYNALGYDFVKDLQAKYQDKFNSVLELTK